MFGKNALLVVISDVSKFVSICSSFLTKSMALAILICTANSNPVPKFSENFVHIGKYYTRYNKK